MEQISPTGVVSYFIHDQLGSTGALANATGNVVGTFGYDPSARRVSATGSAVTALGFAGQYSYSETGFIYLRARYLDPAMGIFLSVDPALPQTRDAFGYAAGDPVNLVDPSGLNPLDGVRDWISHRVCDFVTTVRIGGLALAYLAGTALDYIVAGHVVGLGFADRGASA